MSEVYNSENTLYVEEAAKSYLKEIAKWGKFLAIVGFVMCAFMVIISLLMGSLFATIKNNPFFMGGTSEILQGIFFPIGITFLYLLIAVLYFFPCFFLYKSSVKIKSSIDTQDSNELTLGLEQLKKAFKFVGIYTLVIICIYGIGILFAALGGGMAYFLNGGM